MVLAELMLGVGLSRMGNMLSDITYYRYLFKYEGVRNEVEEPVREVINLFVAHVESPFGTNGLSIRCDSEREPLITGEAPGEMIFTKRMRQNYVECFIVSSKMRKITFSIKDGEFLKQVYFNSDLGVNIVTSPQIYVKDCLIKHFEDKASLQSRTIIIFGDTGSGKSSIINMILKKCSAKVSRSCIGTTFSNDEYKYEEAGVIYRFFDTAGLSESDKGKVPSKDALNNLMKLLASCQGSGVHLLIHVMKEGKIFKDMHDNYKIFYEDICDKKVPIILAVTHCENYVRMMDFYDENKDNLTKVYNFEYKEVVCMTALPKERESTKYRITQDIIDAHNESRESIVASIIKNCSNEGWRMELGYWFTRTIKRVWNKIARIFNLNGLIVSVCNNLKNMYMRFGYSEEEATNKSNEFEVNFKK